MMISSGACAGAVRSRFVFAPVSRFGILGFNEIEVAVRPAQDYAKAIGLGVAKNKVVVFAVARAFHLQNCLIESHRLVPIALEVDPVNLLARLLRGLGIGGRLRRRRFSFRRYS